MTNLTNIATTAAVAAVCAGLVAGVLVRPAPGPTQAEIAAMIDTAVTERLAETAPAPAAGPMDTADLNTAIETFLLDNPRLLESMSVALETEMRAEEQERARIALTTLEDDIYNDPANIVLGNPEGDVTLVEMFDYNCGYCRQVLPDVMALVEEDPGLRVILKEFPILSQGSVDAARVGVLVNKQGVDYARFHTALFSARGAVTGETALAAAETLGLSRVMIELDMNTDDVTAALQRNYTLAQGLGISGTPAFIIGNEVIPGAVGKDELARRIANMRECGATQCPTDG
ncbi:DsbA family protein [Pelagibacterium sediminicola]|uniref:DsbA family protein n=1 Tax=Pelagibacterium sediminicola TaxID=2248761 RepID=UPI000E314A08|nr:DsbA family protein [Pelagibacterium sediminicola]